MKKTKALIIGLVASLSLILGGSIAYAVSSSKPGTSAGTTAEPKAYGLCVNLKTRAVRALQVDNLAKSQYGACKQDGSEAYLGVLGTGYKPELVMPTQLAFSAGGVHYVCSTAKAVKLWPVVKDAAGKVTKVGKAVSPARYACVEAVRPKPTVSPSP